jgi:CubicO group peptidase (beta-lactamase class C family)
MSLTMRRKRPVAGLRRAPALNRLAAAVCGLSLAVVLAACTGINSAQDSGSTAAESGSSSAANEPSGTESSESAAEPAEEAAPQNPNQIPGVPTNEVFVTKAINSIDSLSQRVFDDAGIPGMAVAVVHQGKVVFAQGYGVREIGKPEIIDTDTVFQLASLSKPVGMTVVANEIGKGTVGWETPVVAHLPTFALADPYVTQNVTIADMYSHRSGLPNHAGDLLEDLGYDQAQVFDRLKQLPLNPFRAVYNYTNFGMTAAAESVAAAAGTDWATLSQQDVYGPLGMTNTSSRFADFQANPDRALGHVQLPDGSYQAKYVRDPDAQTAAGGVSSSINDMATWLAMVMNDGTAADGTQIADDEALRAALTPVMRSADGSPTPGSIDGRTGFYGYGMGVGTDSTGRVRLSHSGAFAQGAGTTVLAIPNLDLGIVVLTNAAANGTAEGLVNNFADIAEFGSEQQDWVAGYKRALAGVWAPAGELVGETPPTAPVPAAVLSTYAGTYQNAFWGPVTVTESGSGLVLTAGPNDQQFPLTHWDGQTFTMVPTGENAPDGSISEVTFTVTGDTASAVTVEFWNHDGLGTFTR